MQLDPAAMVQSTSGKMIRKSSCFSPTLRRTILQAVDGWARETQQKARLSSITPMCTGNSTSLDRDAGRPLLGDGARAVRQSTLLASGRALGEKLRDSEQGGRRPGCRWWKLGGDSREPGTGTSSPVVRTGAYSVQAARGAATCDWPRVSPWRGSTCFCCERLSPEHRHVSVAGWAFHQTHRDFVFDNIAIARHRASTTELRSLAAEGKALGRCMYILDELGPVPGLHLPCYPRTRSRLFYY